MGVLLSLLPLQDAFRTLDWIKIREELNELTLSMI